MGLQKELGRKAVGGIIGVPTAMESSKSQPYTNAFFAQAAEGSRRSAEAVVPLVLEMLRPKRVIDVGCGIGAWLSVFRELGVTDILGVDGDYVDRAMLRIPEAKFLAFDLRTPLRLEEKFDLAVSLEVAEHLPPECAELFVDSLVRLAPAILFSAAIPCQGGTDHLNAQWPDYWEKHFRARGYVAIDAIRRRIWHNDNIAWWYAQNIILFIDRTNLERYPGLEGEPMGALSIVHPRLYASYVSEVSALSTRIDPRFTSLGWLLSMVPSVMANYVKRRVRFIWRKSN